MIDINSGSVRRKPLKPPGRPSILIRYLDEALCYLGIVNPWYTAGRICHQGWMLSYTGYTTTAIKTTNKSTTSTRPTLHYADWMGGFPLGGIFLQHYWCIPRLIIRFLVTTFRRHRRSIISPTPGMTPNYRITMPIYKTNTCTLMVYVRSTRPTVPSRSAPGFTAVRPLPRKKGHTTGIGQKKQNAHLVTLFLPRIRTLNPPPRKKSRKR